jgi:hypothetical protein
MTHDTLLYCIHTVTRKESGAAVAVAVAVAVADDEF